MIETVDKKMKYEFLFPKSLVSFKNVIDTLKVAVSQYNSRSKTRPIGKRFAEFQTRPIGKRFAEFSNATHRKAFC
ncbi:hypothetical protein KQY10_17870 [Leptospira interrogans]|nr:hypothetical protein LIH_14210 [Leptospira interrogans serovar Hardjo-prajitno]MCD1167427.1 hypothetical protein [Leptospira interrogans]